ncbi:hypothetical protein GCM10029992_22170 [Glycomyces albus]
MRAASGDGYGRGGVPHLDFEAGVLVHQTPRGARRRLPVIDDASWQVPGAGSAARAVAAGEQEPSVLVTYLPVRSYPELHPSTVRPPQRMPIPIRSCPAAWR